MDAAVLHAADPAVVQALINAGADVNAQTEKGQTPFDLVNLKFSRDMASLLLDSGVKFSEKDKWRNGPCHRPALGGSCAADVSSRNLKGDHRMKSIMKTLIAALAVSIAWAGATHASEFRDGPGKWKIKSEVNPIDDTRKVITYLVAESDDILLLLSDDRVALSARCRSNVTEAFIYWNEDLGTDSFWNKYLGNGGKQVTLRFDKEKAFTQTWSPSTSHDMTFAPGSAVDFLKKLIAHDRLAAQVETYSKGTKTVVFDLTGAYEVVAEVADACNWKLPAKSK